MNSNQGSCQNSYKGNSVDICTDCLTCETEIRADVTLSKAQSIRLWGQIQDCYGNAVENALIKLIEVVDCNGQYVFTGIAHTVSDCQGFYQFDLCTENLCARYKILVGAANTGFEKVLGSGSGNCAPCFPEPCAPCASGCQEQCAPCSSGCQDKCDPCAKVPLMYGCTQTKRC